MQFKKPLLFRVETSLYQKKNLRISFTVVLTSFIITVDKLASLHIYTSSVDQTGLLLERKIETHITHNKKLRVIFLKSEHISFWNWCFTGIVIIRVIVFWRWRNCYEAQCCGFHHVKQNTFDLIWSKNTCKLIPILPSNQPQGINIAQCRYCS